MNSFAKNNDSESSRNQPRKMSASEHFYQEPVNGRRLVYPEQSSFPKAFGQRPTFQPRTPIMAKTSYVYNANQSVGTTNWRVAKAKDNEIQLRTSENAWVPPCLRGKTASDNNTQINEIRKKLLSILNKISPENMTKLTDSITSLPIETDEHLKAVIELLFQKAIDEPSFTPQYAYICTVLNDREVKSKKKAATTSFKKLLTNCCENRFEIMHVHEQKLAKSLEEINHCNDQEVKKQLQSEYDQDEMVHRKKSVGNCRFMCELYKVQILTNGTLEACIKHLLKSPNEETLECACNILKHAGQTLNSKAAFRKLNEYTSSAYKTKISTRIRFMILDIIELKENNWVPRNSRTKPELYPNKVHSNARKPEYEPSVNVQYKPAALPTKISLKPDRPTKVKPSETEIQKNNDRENNDLAKRADTSDFSNSSTAMRVSEVVMGKNSSVSSLVSSETSNTNSYRTLEHGNTEVQVLGEKFRFVLDSITPENMVLSAKSIMSLPIKTDACLINIVDILFQKALDEPSFAPLYAHVCSAMKNIEIQSEDCKKTNTSFAKLLIKSCQDAFESMFNRKRIVARDRNEIESCKDKKIKNELQTKFDRNETVHRRRSVANCRFICELLKVNVLVPPVLEMCLAKLVQSPKELSLECACVILEHVGSTINHSGVLEKLREYSTAHKPNFSPNLRSMILDTLELMDTVTVQPINDVRDGPPMADETNAETSTFAEPPVGRVESSDMQPPSVAQTVVRPEINTQTENGPDVRNKPYAEDRKYDVYNTVKTMINSVTADNKDTAINELSVHLKNIDVMERTIDFLFERAKMHPKTIPKLVSVCSSLRDVSTSDVVEGRNIKPTSLKKQIAIRCNKVLLSGVQNGSSEFTPEQSYTFIGGLINENVLSAHIPVEFLKIVPDKLSNKTLENVCDLLKVAGKKIEQVYSLKKTLKKLTDRISNDVEGIFSRRSGVLLKALVELRDNKWVS